jgi:hypothetical protein
MWVEVDDVWIKMGQVWIKGVERPRASSAAPALALMWPFSPVAEALRGTRTLWITWAPPLGITPCGHIASGRRLVVL